MISNHSNLIQQLRNYIAKNENRKAIKLMISYLEDQNIKDDHLINEAILLSNRLEDWYSRDAFGHAVQITEKNKIIYDLLNCLSQLSKRILYFNTTTQHQEQFNNLDHTPNNRKGAQGIHFDLKAILPFGIIILVSISFTGHVLLGIILGILLCYIFNATGIDLTSWFTGNKD
ncbi:MAG: hypothetical protein AAGD05_02135 [Bacteroidota bacterium]